MFLNDFIYISTGGILKQSIKKENDTMVSGKESTSEIEDSSKQLLKLETEEMRNELKYVLIDDANSASAGVPSIVLSFCIMLYGVLFIWICVNSVKVIHSWRKLISAIRKANMNWIAIPVVNLLYITAFINIVVPGYVVAI